MKRFSIILIVVLIVCLAIIVGLSFVWRAKMQSVQNKEISVIVRSEVSGFDLTIQNEKDLQKFLADIGFVGNEDWDLNQKDTFYESKINTLEIIYSNEPQKKWQMVDIENAKPDGSLPVRSSVGEVLSDKKLSLVIQADASLLGSTESANSAVNDLFVKALSDVLFSKMQADQENILNSYQLESQFLKLAEKS